MAALLLRRVEGGEDALDVSLRLENQPRWALSPFPGSGVQASLVSRPNLGIHPALACRLQLLPRYLIVFFVVYLASEICFPFSSFQVPASGVRPERYFRLPASGEHLRLAVPGSGVFSSFQLPPSSLSLVDVKQRGVSRFQSPSGSSRGKKARDGGIFGFQLPRTHWREELENTECMSMRRVKFRRGTMGGEFPE